MSTKSNRSSGTQHNQRGVTQGNTLVDPVSGLPIDVVVDGDGKRRLAVDANISATIDDVNVHLDGAGIDGDSVYIVDNVSGNKQKINTDGSIDANVELDAADGDNVAISNGTNTADVNANNELLIHDQDAIDELIDINTKLAGPINVVGAVGDLYKLVPKEFDDVEVTAKNGNGDPTTIVYSLAASVVATLTLLYDADGDFQKATRT